MPRGDRTGPLGEGPLTGRRMGYCAGNEHPGFYYRSEGWGRGLRVRFRGGAGFGRGFGPGYRGGFGPGFRHGYGDYYYDRPADVSEKTMIENDIRILKDQLSALEDQLTKIQEKEKE